MTIKADLSLWILSRFILEFPANPKDESFYYGRMLTLRFLFGYIASFVFLGYVWNVLGFKSTRNTLRFMFGYSVFLVCLSMYIMDHEYLYDAYWYKEHLGKLVVWYKLSELVLDVFTMSQCAVHERPDIRFIGGYAALSYSLSFIEILLIWCGITV